MRVAAIVFIVALALPGCSPQAGADAQLKSCVASNNSFGNADKLFDALERFENYLLEQGALPNRTKQGYRALLPALRDSTRDLPRLDQFCKGFQQCWRLTTPATLASLIVCLDENAAETELASQEALATAASRARARSDIGPEYFSEALEAMNREMFDQLLYRGVLLQVVAATMDYRQAASSDAEGAHKRSKKDNSKSAQSFFALAVLSYGEAFGASLFLFWVSLRLRS